MSGTVNKVIIVGNLGADPEINKTRDGRPVVTLSVATSDTWRDKNTGERKEKTEWHRVVIFTEGLAKIAEQYLKKGMKVYVEGKLRTIKWKDQGGADRYTTQINVENFDGTFQMITSGGGAGGPADREC
ncbi:MAG: Single-stranded DNA-binding protein [Afipia sp.]|jgi:single-strand DNA-binding protein|nr:MAG: Single-stranded DNA-binding protein [Afipia sp.]